ISGNSENIIKAVETAKKNGLYTICFLGDNGGKLKDICDLPLIVPSNNTPRIQEGHELIMHILCELVEEELSKYKD
ncbi:phosphoheptose isomerase, partial [Candidatus Pacearchaeota archaeon]|nr:phosphoheptose isomerase [Candidatus Pacearchaeota archaeon]